MDDELLTVTQLAKELKVSVPTVYRMVSRGDIAVCNLSGIKRFLRSDVDAYLKRNRIDVKENE